MRVFVRVGGKAVPFITLENKAALKIPKKQTELWRMPQETDHLETAVETA